MRPSRLRIRDNDSLHARCFSMDISENCSPEVLVVEDNHAARQLLCDMLLMLGYRPHCVETGEAALGVLRHKKFDVLFADINLPGMSGLDLARIAVQTLPSIRVIFASGYGYLVADKLEFGFVLLPKPYGLAQLQYALDQTGKGAARMNGDDAASCEVTVTRPDPGATPHRPWS